MHGLYPVAQGQKQKNIKRLWNKEAGQNSVTSHTADKIPGEYQDYNFI